MSDNPTLQIPKDVIEPIIQAHITSAVAAALVGHQDLIRAAVAKVMQQTVDSEGKPSTYSSSRPFIEWLMSSAIRKAAKQAIEEEVAKHQDVIRASIAEQLKSSRSPLVKQLVNAMTGAFTDPTNLKYNLELTVDSRK